MISGLCSLLWTIIVFTGKHSVHVKHHTSLLLLLVIGILAFFATCIFRPIVLWMIRHTSNAKSVKESHVCTIFILVLASSMYGEYFGIHFLFGPIVLGMVIPDGPPLGSALVDKLELFVSCIILPIFFVVSAARIDFSTISSRNFLIIECLAVFTLLWKIIGVLLPSLYWKMPMSDALNLGLILSSQGIMEVLIFERAKSIELIDKESYSIMVLSMCITTGILAPIVKFSYKPSKRYTTGEWMTLQHANPRGEIRILACLHYQEHTPSIINLFEASYPHPQAPMCLYVVHLIELQGRSAPVLVAHHPGMRNPSESNESEHIINALRYFELENRDHVTVFPYTAISPYASMHHDVCSLAAEKRVSLVIVLFHKHPLIHVSEEEANAKRAVNCNIIKESPSSVGILVDRGFLSCSAFSLLHKDVYRVGLIFLGGPDDREALAYACRMAQHPNIRLTVVRFIDDSITYSADMELDVDAINAYKDAQMKNKQCFYQEETVRDSMGFSSVMRGMEGCFDLIIVGRRHDDDSPLLAGLDDWNEFPELGVVGDMIVSLDSKFKASVLVVQQASLVRQNPSAVFEMPWPARRGASSGMAM
ncbi:putative K+/H+-antiporter [Handroanthus impetiginosus]|uniref:Putative K+/H+-antiporter n=1 Tax=Handroanthus impetiginosus TaxID=429701 RepID=A0A2G9GVC9_9LAMI|nr:putative K+/H+-antiporter [Handroanthus impetiginosus]